MLSNISSLSCLQELPKKGILLSEIKKGRRFTVIYNLLMVFSHILFSAQVQLKWQQPNPLYWGLLTLNLFSLGLTATFLFLNLAKSARIESKFNKLLLLKLLNLSLIAFLYYFESAGKRISGSFKEDFKMTHTSSFCFVITTYLICLKWIKVKLWLLFTFISVGLYQFLDQEQSSLPSDAFDSNYISLAFLILNAIILFYLCCLFTSEKRMLEENSLLFENLMMSLSVGAILLDSSRRIIFTNEKMLRIFSIESRVDELQKFQDLEKKLSALNLELFRKMRNICINDNGLMGMKKPKTTYKYEKKVKFSELITSESRTKYYTKILSPSFIRKKSSSNQISSSRRFSSDLSFTPRFNLLSPDSVLSESSFEMNEFEEKQFKVKVSVLKGKAKYTLITLADVTEAQTISNSQGEKDYKENLLNSFSHELKTPLNNSQNILECALEDKEVSESIKEKYIVHPLNSINLLTLMIHDIVDFLKMEADQLDLKLESVSPRAIVKEVYDMTYMKAKKKGLELEFQMEPNFPSYSIFTDRNRFLRILSNLVLNCIKYTFSGFVRISVSSQRLQIAEDLALIISISDSRLVSIQNIGTERSENHSGLEGKSKSQQLELGLEINKLLMSKLLPFTNAYHFQETPNGVIHTLRIPFESMFLRRSGTAMPSLSQFSLFKFDDVSDIKEGSYSLPLIQQLNNNDLSRRGSLYSPLSLRKKKERFILIVDDEAFNLLSLEMIIAKENCSVLKALNGKAAVDTVKSFYYEKDQHQGKIELALIDLNMPVMDGFECTKELLKLMEDGVISKFPIYACSANDSAEYQEKSKLCGMNGFLSKPVNPLSIKGMLSPMKKIGSRCEYKGANI